MNPTILSPGMLPPDPMRQGMPQIIKPITRSAFDVSAAPTVEIPDTYQAEDSGSSITVPIDAPNQLGSAFDNLVTGNPVNPMGNVRQSPQQPGMYPSVGNTPPASWDQTQDPNQIGLNNYNPITGITGTIAKRNRNPGALKLEYKGAKLGGKVSTTPRSRRAAIKRAKELYPGAVTLDRGGFIVFDNEASGKAAQIRLQQRAHKDRTIPEMLNKYAIDDGSGKAHNKNYANRIYSETAKAGYNLKGKKIGDMSSKELNSMVLAMAKVEGGN